MSLFSSSLWYKGQVLLAQAISKEKLYLLQSIFCLQKKNTQWAWVYAKSVTEVEFLRNIQWCTVAMRLPGISAHNIFPPGTIRSPEDTVQNL